MSQFDVSYANWDHIQEMMDDLHDKEKIPSFFPTLEQLDEIRNRINAPEEEVSEAEKKSMILFLSHLDAHNRKPETNAERYSKTNLRSFIYEMIHFLEDDTKEEMDEETGSAD